MALSGALDWHSRKVLAWRLSNTLCSGFRIEALEEALRRYEILEDFNARDEGLSAHQRGVFTCVLKDAGLAISKGGMGPVAGHYVRSAVSEKREVRRGSPACLRNRGRSSRGPAQRHLRFYNGEKRHQSIGRMKPDEV